MSGAQFGAFILGLIVVVIVMIVTGQHQRIHDEPPDVVANGASVADGGPEVDAAVDARVVRLVRRGREPLVSPRHEGSSVAPVREGGVVAEETGEHSGRRTAEAAVT